MQQEEHYTACRQGVECLPMLIVYNTSITVSSMTIFWLLTQSSRRMLQRLIPNRRSIFPDQIFQFSVAPKHICQTDRNTRIWVLVLFAKNGSVVARSGMQSSARAVEPVPIVELLRWLADAHLLKVCFQINARAHNTVRNGSPYGDFHLMVCVV